MRHSLRHSMPISMPASMRDHMKRAIVTRYFDQGPKAVSIIGVLMTGIVRTVYEGNI